MYCYRTTKHIVGSWYGAGRGIDLELLNVARLRQLSLPFLKVDIAQHFWDRDAASYTAVRFGC
jgi:hypothetical protein